MNYFYDSYAIVELFYGSERYSEYAKLNGVTSYYNALEVFYTILRRGGLQRARIALKKMKPIIIHPDVQLIELAMMFRFKHKKKKLSYADCLGYVMARKENMKFLTGDEGFRGMKNIEFVK